MAQIEFKPAEEETELANLFRVNPNIVVVCDSDRASENSPIKARVERIRAEVETISGAHIWITEAREIENYLPGSVLEKASGSRSLPDPGQYESFFLSLGKEDIQFKSYVEAT